MWDLYVATGTSDECTEESIVDGYGVDILTMCDSDCAGKIKDLSEELPDCYYDYEYMNKKQDVLTQLDGCNGASSYVSVTLYPDSTIETASSPGSDLESDFDPSGSGLLRSGDDPSDTTLDSSAVGIGSSAAAPHGKLYLWVVAVALAGIVMVF